MLFIYVSSQRCLLCVALIAVMNSLTELDIWHLFNYHSVLCMKIFNVVLYNLLAFASFKANFDEGMKILSLCTFISIFSDFLIIDLYF